MVAISTVSDYLNFRTQKRQLVETMVLGADELSRSITSATWQFMLDHDRKAAYQIMQTIANKEGVVRIRMFNREGHLSPQTIPTNSRSHPLPISPMKFAHLATIKARSSTTCPGFTRAVSLHTRERQDHQHGLAYLQRALVRPCKWPCAQCLNEDA